MRKSIQRHALFASTIFCGAALLGVTQASAQAAAAAAAPADTGSAVTEVVVTGSRIPHANLESASPLTIVSSGEVKAEGVINIETLLNNLPSIMAGQNSTVSNGSSGTATVNLRGLGPARTLVLIDGRRLQAGDPVVPVADLNFIPTPLVERVEILTGGASSTYGADAVAGVVNFIMKKDFEGIQVDGQYGFDQHDNNSFEAGNFLHANAAGPLQRPGNVVESNNAQVSIVMGVNSPDNKGNVTAYAEYTNLQPILESTRDFSDCSLTDVTGAKGLTNGAHGCVGSSNNAHGRINLIGQSKSFTNFKAPAGTFVPYTGAAAFNFGPFNFFQRTDNRYNLGAFGHYQVNEHADVYLDAMFMDDDTTAQIAPSGFFQGPDYFIPCNNAFLSAAQATQIGCGTAFEGPTASSPNTPAGSVASTIGFRFAGHDRDTDLRHDEYRIVLGSRGDIADGWTYDAYLQYGESVFQSKIIGDVSDAKLQNALNTTSKTTCVVGGACVPVNIFADNAISQAAVNYLLTPGLIEGSTTEQVAELDINGDLGQYGLKSPWAKEAVKINLGIDDRRENLVETVDNEEASGDLSGSGGATPPASGSFNVYEVYTELSVPIISDMDFIKSLDFDGGYRYSHYDDVGQTETYMFKLEYAPISDVKFRASFNHAVRAPNVDELFTPITPALFTGSDPCAPAKVGGTPADTLAQCERSGVTPAQYAAGITPCPANQCTQETGGNPNLKPEDSDTTSLGVVFTPTFIKNFSATVDYYNIQVNGIIQGISPNISLDNCLNGNLTFCPLVHRDAAGDLLGPNGFVVSTNQNTGYLHTTGYDFEVNYRIKLADMYLPDWGSLSFNFVGTYTEKFANQPVTGGGHYDCAGLYGPVCGNPDPHWRHKLRVTWSTPWNFDVSGQWRYLGGVKLDTNEGNPLLNNGGFDSVDKDIPDYSYFDLTGNWRVKDGLTFRAGVNNVFDKNPPIIAGVADQTGVGNGNTYPGIYDALGRQFFIGLTAKF